MTTKVPPQLSRRELFRVSALATTGAAIAACNNNTNPTDAGTDIVQDTGNGTGDVHNLNALLSAEYNAIQAYAAGAGILNGLPATDPLHGIAPVVVAIATHFQSQHQDHAGLLSAAVTAMGGTPVSMMSVTFTPPAGFTANGLNVLRLAANLEKQAAVAYTQTVANLSTAANRMLAGTISGDETQHFVLLYGLIHGWAGPSMGLTTTTANMVVPASVVFMSGTIAGLDSVPDYTFP